MTRQRICFSMRKCIAAESWQFQQAFIVHCRCYAMLDSSDTFVCAACQTRSCKSSKLKERLASSVISPTPGSFLECEEIHAISSKWH